MKKYNLFQNMKFIHDKQVTFKKSFKWRLPLYIILSIVLPMISAIIPSIVVSSLELDAGIEVFIIALAITLSIYLICNSILVYSKEILDMDNTFIRLTKAVYEMGEKSLTMDYANLEPYECRRRQSRAQQSLDGNWNGVEGMMKNTPALIINLVGIIVYSIILFRVSWVVFLILLGMSLINIICTVLSNKFYVNISSRMTEPYVAHNSVVNSVVNEAYSKDMRVYKYKPLFIKMTDVLMKKMSKSRLEQTAVLGMPSFSDSLFTILRDSIAYIILIIGVYNGKFTVVDFTFYLSVILGISVWLNGLSDCVGNLYLENGEVNNFREFLEYPNVFKREEGESIGELIKGNFEIEFDNVSFTYPESTTETLTNLSFKIEPNQKVALVGVNGAGKTTIVKLLCGLYHPTKGRILVGGKDITELNINEYYSLLSVVFQDDVALEYTIAENVSMHVLENTDMDLVKDCLEKAGLKEKVDSLVLKELTFIGKIFSKDGIKLSGGETQKLILARALYKNSPILILDEPTAALDPLAESDLYQKYNTLTIDKSSLFISHRLSSTKFCDKIIFLENGTIKEEGTHEELMSLNGAYKEMFDIQSQYYKEGSLNEEN